MRIYSRVAFVILVLSAGCRTTEEGAAASLGRAPAFAEGPGARFTSGGTETAPTTELYRIGPRDRIRVKVLRHAEFDGELAIDARGRITIPTAGVEIAVSGLNVLQIASKVAMEIRPFVVRTPQVSVDVMEANSKSYYVVGGVNRPGRYRMGHLPVSARDALLAAGLFDGGAEIEKVTLIKSDPVRPQAVPLNAAALVRGDLSQDVVLSDGDIIFVPTAGYSRVNRLQVDLELHLDQGASMESLHKFVQEKMLSASAE